MNIKKSFKLFAFIALFTIFINSCNTIEKTSQSNLEKTTGQLIKDTETKTTNLIEEQKEELVKTDLPEEEIVTECSSGWKCKDANYLGYQLLDCSWLSLEYCKNGCQDGKCKIEQICTPNTFKCDGNILRKCNTGGSYWDYYKLCFDGCENGECLFKDKVAEPVQEPTPSASDVVSEVTDGDTIKLHSGEKVRLIGINAPETGQYYSSEAKNKLKELVEGKIVKLENDISNADRYGRLLRYIYVDDLFVNLEMIKLGYAEAYKYPPDVKYSNLFEEAENEAKAKSLDIWKKSDENCIIVSEFNYDAEGNDNYNLNDEYVILKNICSEIIDLSDWTIKDEATHIYTFSNFNLDANAQVTFYTGSGKDTSTELYWGMTSTAVWNNGGDTLFLRDNNGNLVLEESY